MKESPLFVRTYDMLLWLIPQVQKFPRIHRFGLAEHIQKLGFGFQDSLVAAGKSSGKERQDWLRKADIQLEQLRVCLRLVRDLQLWSVSQYEHSAKQVMEVGRLLGAWIKQTDL